MLSFYISIALWLRRYDTFDLSRDPTIEVSCDFLGGVPHLDSAPYQFFRVMDLVNVDIRRFRSVTWPRDWCVTWLCGWGPFIPCHQLPKFGSIGLVKAEIKRFWFVTWPRGWCIMWLCRWCSLVLSHHPAKFGVHSPCESWGITFIVCHVTTISKCHVTLWVGSPHPKPPPC